MSLPQQIEKLLDLIEKTEDEKIDVVKSFKQLKLGSMVLFVYDPKWKNELPFYDVLPVVIPIARLGDRFLGWNLHYLPYTWRVSLAKEMMKKISWRKRMTYADVKDAIESAKIPHAMLYYCIRTYLYSHIRSQMKEFHSQNYQMVVKEVMPRFKKETEEAIYKILMSRMYKRLKGIPKSRKKK